LETAKYWIITVKFPKKQPTSIAKNYKLDTIDAPLPRQLPSSRAVNLVNHPPTQFIHAKNEEYFQGVLNPLETRVITRCVNIDTRFRDNFYASKSSDFTFQMPFKLNKVVSMQLASVELPITFYGVSATYGNHYFWIQMTTIDTGQIYSTLITVKDGNYTAADLVAAVNTSMHKNSHFLFIEFVLDITDTGSGTGKVTVQAVQNKPLVENIKEITLDFQKDMAGNDTNQKSQTTMATELSMKLGWNLGFLKPIYEGAVKYTADTIIEPATVRYLFLAIDDYHNSGNNHFLSAFQNSVLNPNILARISVKGTYFSLVMENDLNIVSEPRRYFGPVDIQRLRIRLFDEYGRVVDMNNANFSFCLNFKLMYDL
jgi:hypothetical protein